MRYYLLLILFVFCSFSHAKLKKWNEKMQELSNTFTNLLPQLSETKPITPATKKSLETETKKLLDLVHTINMGQDTIGNPLPPEADPTLGFVSHLLKREVKQAYQAIQDGHVVYGKDVLRGVTGYCMACHSRHDKGPDFVSSILNSNLKNLTSFQKAELLVATRQFDAALDEYKEIILNKDIAKKDQWAWSRAIKSAFTIAIRVKRDPDYPLKMIDSLASFTDMPSFYSENFPNWKKSLEQWKQEKEKKYKSEKELYDEVLSLNQKAKSLQEYPIDHSADIYFLRSTTLAHELLSKYPSGKYFSETLLIIGEAYELLEDRIITPLPNMYYETCIRKSAHTKIAEKCYLRFEQNILFGYSGSGGTFIPSDIKELQKELKVLAKVKK